MHRLAYAPTYSGNISEQFRWQGGIGLRAARDIPRGTPILYEKALFRHSQVGNFNLQPPVRQAFNTLGVPPRRPHTDQERFDVNNFQMGKGERGVFLEASRFNHSCVPSAYFAWNERLKLLTVHAIIDIPKGEQIFINYLYEDFLENKTQRQEALATKYGFTCQCQACRRGTTSEDRRFLMQILNGNIRMNKDVITLEDRIWRQIDMKWYIALLQEEGLFYPQLADAYHKEVKWHINEMKHVAAGTASTQSSAAHRSDALKIAKTKLELDVVCNGHESPELTKTLRQIFDLERM